MNFEKTNSQEPAAGKGDRVEVTSEGLGEWGLGNECGRVSVLSF